jgi:hypothetical protein
MSLPFRKCPFHTPRIEAMVALALLHVCLCAGCGSNTEPVEKRPAPKFSALPSPSLPADSETPPPGQLPQFVDVASRVGVNFRREDDIQGQHRLVEANGGGVAWWDFDGDGWLDLFFTNGCSLPTPKAANSPTDQLYRNTGLGAFETATIPAGLNQVGYHQGCATGDFDNDGFPDLYVAAFGHNVLWHNNGDGTFQDVTSEAKVDSPEWSSSCAFGDLNGDGLLDLFVVNYVDFPIQPPRLCPYPGSPDGYVQCSPTLFPASPDKLFINDGEGHFRDVTQAAQVEGVDGKGLGIVLFDMNQDGRLDVFIANDGMPNFLYINETSRDAEPGSIPKLVERGLELGAAVSPDGRARAGMGVACGDYDGDGWQDLLVTNYFAEPNSLFRNSAGTSFVEYAEIAQLKAPSLNVLGFGTEFFDFDNDGRLDLFVANGHVDDVTWRNAAESYHMPAQCFRNDGTGRFSNVSKWAGPYFQEKWLGRGTAQGDWDRDGDLDLAVSHQADLSAILQNNTNTNGKSVCIKLVGISTSNRSAIGVRCRARLPSGAELRELCGGGSFQSASSHELHIGLGNESLLPQLDVVWPSGSTQSFSQVRPGVYVLIELQGLVYLPLYGSKNS